MAQLVRMLATKSEDLSLIPSTHPYTVVCIYVYKSIILIRKSQASIEYMKRYSGPYFVWMCVCNCHMETRGHPWV